MRDSRCYIPENMGLVINDYMAPYEFYDGFQMIRVNGSGVVATDSFGEGWIGPDSMSRVVMDGELCIDVIPAKDQTEAPRPYIFDSVQFCGEVDLTVIGEAELVFVSCSFTDDTVFKVSGEPTAISLHSCMFGANAIFNCANSVSDVPIKIVDCYAEDTAELLVGSDDAASQIEAESSGSAVEWVKPLAATALVALLSIATKASQKHNSQNHTAELEHVHTKQ